ncbi:ABC transporter ATP-binding protein [Actibacterium sp. 188UL27-1]|uniref:ABC transporter ATP-binding protein n=1 Tax=Actibacterium sp. 188UL27-1 TaxID=2786961 RepID=UPI00195658B2|nr:ABC transporter ATP-binding protein [Actibacterium sp. 188UL27-1]
MFQFFENLVDPYTAEPQHDVPPNRIGPFIWSMMRPFRRLLALNACTAFATAAAELVLIFYLGRLVDLLAGASPATFWANHSWELIAVLIFVLIMRPAIQTLDTALIKNAIQPNVAALGRWRSHCHVLRQPVGWFEADFAGRIANRVVQMPAATGDLVFQIMNALAFTVAYLVGAGVLLANAHPMLLIPLGLWLILYAVLLRWSLKRIRPAARASSAARSRTLGFVVDSYANINSVKLFSHTSRETDTAVGILENHRRTYMAENRIVTAMDAGLVVLNGVLIAGIIGWSLVMWTNGTATVGVVAAAGALALRINAMTGWILAALSAFFRALGIISEGMETVAQPIGLIDAPTAGTLPLSGGRIEVCNLTHNYGRTGGGIQNISFTIAPGERVGLVGRSGAGKSTLVKAILRLYDPEGGQILIDGRDIATVSQDSLRAQIGMVQQDSMLLHRSIRDNIMYGRPDASEAQMIAAARQAKAHDFIDDLRDSFGKSGYDAHVGERGVKLSGGQRQRIALARVILKDAPILILDEATSALDSEVEAQIQQTLYGMMKGKTVIAIAHRLSTIAQMDRILVLDDGAIVQNGVHADLLAQDGLYARLWHRQSAGLIVT